MNMARRLIACGMYIAGLLPLAAWAHGPIFSFNPHTLYKGGIDISGAYNRNAARGRAANIYEVTGRYGVTGDWTLGVTVPYEDIGAGAPGEASFGQLTELGGMPEPARNINGLGDVHLVSQYRFWRLDKKGVQRSAAFVNNLKLNTAGAPQGTGSTELISGVVYGYESIRWYHWASVGYVWRSGGPNGLHRGDTVLLNLVGGWRPRKPVFGEADTVFVLALNGEVTGKASSHGRNLVNTGGTQVFLSPGLIWTSASARFAVRPGIQIPVYSDLNGGQPRTDYRLKVQFEYHF